MRPIATAFAVLTTLVLLAAPLAFAGGEQADKGRARADEAKAAAPARGEDARGDHARRGGDDAGDKDDRAGQGNGTARAEARKTLLDAFRAQLQKWRDAWKENATAIREACHAAEPAGDNATKEERRAWAHCIRDGYAQFLDVLRMERKAWRAELKDAGAS